MLAYGSAAASVQVLWQCGLLPLLLPHHAAYLRATGYPRDPVDMPHVPNMLIDMLRDLDQTASPQDPAGVADVVAVVAAPIIAREIARLRPRLVAAAAAR